MSKVSHSNTKGVELTLSWQPASNGHVPQGAVEAGNGCYVVRAKHSNEWVPGKLPAGHSSAYISYAGEEHSCPDYEVLVATNLGAFGSGYEWRQASGDNLPKRAVVCGSDHGAPLYAAKTTIEGELCVGKAQPDHHCAYFPWGGKEHKHAAHFDVLVLN